MLIKVKKKERIRTAFIINERMNDLNKNNHVFLFESLLNIYLEKKIAS